MQSQIFNHETARIVGVHFVKSRSSLYIFFYTKKQMLIFYFILYILLYVRDNSFKLREVRRNNFSNGLLWMELLHNESKRD